MVKPVSGCLASRRFPKQFGGLSKEKVKDGRVNRVFVIREKVELLNG